MAAGRGGCRAAAVVLAVRGAEAADEWAPAPAGGNGVSGRVTGGIRGPPSAVILPWGAGTSLQTRWAAAGAIGGTRGIMDKQSSNR